MNKKVLKSGDYDFGTPPPPQIGEKLAFRHQKYPQHKLTHPYNPGIFQKSY